MVQTTIIVELVVIIVALAVALWWLYTNYDTISKQFFDFLSEISFGIS